MKNMFVSKIPSFLKQHKIELLIIIALVLIAGITHGFNMFHYPTFFDDEGTYISQAQAFMDQGRLAPYTYWYDHAPAGWIILSFWLFITQHIFHLSTALESGRIFMLFLNIISTILIYFIVRKIIGSKTLAFFASILFCISPLAISLHRVVFLDNIMVALVLGAILILLISKRMSSIFISGSLFGLAILTKETAVFFIPGGLLLLYCQLAPNRRKIATVAWLGSLSIIFATYILYALLKGEFFQAHTLLGGKSAHVSLLESLHWQSSRKGGFFLSRDSEFYYTFTKSWFKTDPYLIVVGSISIFLVVIHKFKQIINPQTAIGLFGLSYIFYLVRGGIINDQYLIPLIPFMCICSALVINRVIEFLTPRSHVTIVRNTFAIGLILFACLVNFGKFNVYTADQTSAQLASMRWLQHNIKKSDGIVDVDGFVIGDLLPRKGNENAYVGQYQHYWKVDQDSYVKFNVLKNDWKNIHYILTTQRMEHDIQVGNLPFTRTSQKNSNIDKSFSNLGVSNFLTKYNKQNQGEIVIAHSGTVKLYKRNTLAKINLDESWKTYKTNFIQSYGQIVDGNTSTSEGQSYAMLRAVQQNDKATFDGAFGWMRDHMQYRKTDSLFSWKWQKINNVWVQTDANTATDADQDSAYALLQGYSKWHDTSYLTQSKKIIDDIWNKEVVEVNGRYYLAASAVGKSDDGSVLINPSYIAPMYYKAFAKIDPTHDWQQMTQDSYTYLAEIQNKDTGLVPDWAQINQFGDSIPLAIDGLSTNAGYDAFRTGYRIGQDSSDPRSITYLKPLIAFYKSEWSKRESISAIYTLDGKPIVNYGDLAQYGAIVAILHAQGEKLTADNIYKKRIDSQYRHGSWGRPGNYYNQNWVWFGTSAYNEQ